jgi:hypothetical protein
MLDALVVVCGDAFPPAPPQAVEVVPVPARPGRQDVDPLLDRIGGRRLVVAGTDADLAAVVLRLLHTERLDGVPVGFVPASMVTATGTASAVAEIFGLPGEAEQALRLALHGEVDPVPLIRDDAGGVLVGRGVLRRLQGVVYCDDDRVLRGAAPRLEVSPDPDAGRDTSVGGLLVRVWSGRLFRRGIGESSGRAVQIGCSPNQPVSDGVEHERPVRRWTWYRHTANLRLIRGLT